MKSPKCCKNYMKAFGVKSLIMDEIIFFQCEKCGQIEGREFVRD